MDSSPETAADQSAQPSTPPSVEPTPVPSQTDAEFQKVLEAVQRLRPSEDTKPLVTAYEYAKKLHEGQFRKSGEPYLMHPIAVCEILADAQMDMICLVTGMLHDVVEDTPVTIEELKKQFGEEVARCVDGVTKLSKVNFYSVEQRQAESVRKMLLAMVSDIRVILVKFADRLHNMRTLAALRPEQQMRIAQETIEIYAPLAHRLGMGKIRGELEDLAFQYVDPEAATEVVKEIESKRAANEQYLAEIVRDIEAGMRRDGIPARVQSRVKRAYSVYQKLKRQKISIDQVYDLLAVRIITDSVKSCYAALGVIHNEWHPIPGRIKDFIAIPRPNLYQSLHTSVIGPGGLNVEIQIRTEEMHRLAEEGIAAHWKYKEGKRGPAEEDQRIAWLRSLVEWQKEMRDSSDFMSTLKIDLYPEEVYTFTPQGKVIALPRDASPIDFAYEVHSNVGNECVGAKVNGRIVPLRYALKNGDVVEILRQNGHLPSKDWLSLVKTSKARNKIKHVINTTERAKAIEIGEKYFEREARRLGAGLSRFTKSDLEAVAREYGYTKMEDLHAALGYGKYSARQVLIKLSPELAKNESEPPPKPAPPPSDGSSPRPGTPVPGGDDLVIKVSGADDLLLYRAKCCNPIKGDPIVGFVTRGKGVAVHSANCTNVQNLMYEPERRIDVEWARSAQESFAVKMIVYTDDRPGLLQNVTTVLYDENCNIKTLEARPDERRQDDSAVIDTTIEVKDKKQLDRILSAIRRISGVRDVERAS